MSHEEFSKLIGPYLDGELSAEEREKVENCLADSAECRQMASELEELDRVARGDSPPAVSDDEWQEVLSSVRRTEKIVPFETVKSRRRWLAPLAGLAAPAHGGDPVGLSAAVPGAWHGRSRRKRVPAQMLGLPYADAG